MLDRSPGSPPSPAPRPRRHGYRQTCLPYGERGGAVVYLPTGAVGTPQPVVYWGGSGLTREMRSIEEEFTPAFDFIVRSGRAVVAPIFSGGYGRPDPRPAATQGRTSPLGRTDHGYRDIAIRWHKELRTTIDYLETRPDIDTDVLGFYGFSFGGGEGPIALAVEPRLDAAVLNVGGLPTTSYPLPEVDAFNFAPRVTVPVLMINGEYDVVFPYDTSQKPLFDLLGTDPEHKRHHVSPASHFVPHDELIRETLDWFDRYLGVPGG